MDEEFENEFNDYYDHELIDDTMILNVRECPFTKSKLKKKKYFYTLEIASWPFEKVILSAFYYVLEKAVTSNNTFLIGLYCEKIMVFFFYKNKFIYPLIDIFVNIKILETNKYCCILGFTSFFSTAQFKLKFKYFTRQKLLLFFLMIHVSKIEAKKLIDECYKINCLEPISSYLLLFEE